jgi:Na+/H+ antiporter NhaA
MNKNQMFKKLSAMVKTNVLQAPHPTLVAFGISAAITIAMAVGMSMMTSDHIALAVRHFDDWWR